MTNEDKKPDPRAELSQNQRSFLDRIEGLSLVYNPNAKEIPQSAWAFWFDAVKGATLNEIGEAISDWSKTQSRMMTPADLYKTLQTKRTNKREKLAAEEVKQNHEPIPDVVAQALNESIRVANAKATPSNAWARRLMIKEAYGFVMTEYFRKSWREELGYPDGYNFEDTNGVFPLEQYPNERRSLYHDCQVHFISEYSNRHGAELVYDKELATKRYPTQALRYDGRGNPVREVA